MRRPTRTRGLVRCGGALVRTGGTTMPVDRPTTLLGSAGGAAAGGLLGAARGGHAPGMAAGTMLGGRSGGAIGDRLDAAERRTMHHTTH
jgi:uncharacterized protein YcfJ